MNKRCANGSPKMLDAVVKGAKARTTSTCSYLRCEVGRRGRGQVRFLARVPKSFTAAFAILSGHLALGKAFVEHLMPYQLCAKLI